MVLENKETMDDIISRELSLNQVEEQFGRYSIEYSQYETYLADKCKKDSKIETESLYPQLKALPEWIPDTSNSLKSEIRRLSRELGIKSPIQDGLKKFILSSIYFNLRNRYQRLYEKQTE